MKKKSLRAIACALLSIMLIGCAAKKGSLVGEFSNSKGATITFNSDGTFKDVDQFGFVTEGKWKEVEKGQYIIEANTILGKVEGKVTMIDEDTYELSFMNTKQEISRNK